MPQFKTLDDLHLTGKRVLLRVDLNVPMKDGRITDSTRIDRILPSVKHLVDAGARVVLLSHFGRPKGKTVAAFSLAPLVAALSAALDGRPIAFAETPSGPEALRVIDRLQNGEIALLENLRFHPGEEANDEAFAQDLATLGDVYVNDAFSAAHRAHASTEALARLLPSAAGRLMQAELEHLQSALESPQAPVVAVVGGAKVSTKLALLSNLLTRVDTLVIGGGMANTFLHAQGYAVGRSLCEADLAATAREILDRAVAASREILLPSDVVVAEALAAGAATETVTSDAVPEEQMILDLGPATVARIVERIQGARTLVWNGPLGCFETPPFDGATVAAARAAAAATQGGQLLSVAGGGDTVAALARAGVVEDFSYVSTAGGAFLEWLEGKTLPGVAALAPAG